MKCTKGLWKRSQYYKGNLRVRKVNALVMVQLNVELKSTPSSREFRNDSVDALQWSVVERYTRTSDALCGWGEPGCVSLSWRGRTSPPSRSCPCKSSRPSRMHQLSAPESPPDQNSSAELRGVAYVDLVELADGLRPGASAHCLHHSTTRCTHCDRNVGANC